MGGSCGTYVGEEKLRAGFWWGNWREGELGLRGVMKWLLHVWPVRSWSLLIWLSTAKGGKLGGLHKRAWNLSSSWRSFSVLNTLVHVIGRKTAQKYVPKRCRLFSVDCRWGINLLTPNVNYSWCTASLTSKVAFYIFIQQI